MPEDGEWKSDSYGFVWLNGDWKCKEEIEHYFNSRNQPIPIQYRYWESDWSKGPVGKERLKVELVLEEPERSEEEEEETESSQPAPEKKKRGRPKKTLTDLKK